MTIISCNIEQEAAEAAVVIQTVLRPSLARAVRSVFRQEGVGRLHLLVGVDQALGDREMLEQAAAECPAHVMLSVVDLGYSTAHRYGGVHSNAYGGALRTMLTFAANSRFVAYLDDDDWYGADHLARLLKTIGSRHWAFSRRWLVDPRTGWPICPDEWDSVGPGRGINQARFGGFVQPSGLMLNKVACQSMTHLWANAAFSDGRGEDRLVFDALRNVSWASTGEATYFCTLSEDSITHTHHITAFRQRGLNWLDDRSQVDQLNEHLRVGRALLIEGRPVDALSASAAALAIHPNHPGALKLRAACLAKMGRATESAAAGAFARFLCFPNAMTPENARSQPPRPAC